MQCVVSPSSGDIFSSSSISVLYEHNAAPHMLCCPHYYYYWLQRYEYFLARASFFAKKCRSFEFMRKEFANFFDKKPIKPLITLHIDFCLLGFQMFSLFSFCLSQENHKNPRSHRKHNLVFLVFGCLFGFLLNLKFAHCRFRVLPCCSVDYKKFVRFVRSAVLLILPSVVVVVVVIVFLSNLKKSHFFVLFFPSHVVATYSGLRVDFQ